MSSHEQVAEFMRRVENLFEVEYGDFKRKVGHYINQLEQGLAAPEQRRIVAEMRREVIYDAKGDIDYARDRALELAHKLLH